MKEKGYNDFTKLAKEGCDIFCGLESCKLMASYQSTYRKKSGKSATHVDNKEDFYEFVANKNEVKNCIGCCNIKEVDGKEVCINMDKCDTCFRKGEEEFDYAKGGKQMHADWMNSKIGGVRIPWDKLSGYAQRSWRKKSYDKWFKEKKEREAQN